MAHDSHSAAGMTVTTTLGTWIERRGRNERHVDHAHSARAEQWFVVNAHGFDSLSVYGALPRTVVMPPSLPDGPPAAAGSEERLLPVLPRVLAP